MKQPLFIAMLTLLQFTAKAQQKPIAMHQQHIETVLQQFASAVDAQNTTQSGNFLHPDFRVVLNNFKGSGTVTLLNKSQYLAMMADGKVGGTNRTLQFLLTDIQGDAALVKLQLTSVNTTFTNYYSLVKQSGEWLIIQDIPQMMLNDKKQ